MECRGCVQIYTGDGKGKTTAALGLAFRAAGQGLNVLMLQFLKNGGCGEHKSAKALGFELDCGESIGLPPWNKQAEPLWKEHTEKQLEKAFNAIKGDYDILILDELLGAINKGFISIDQATRLIDEKKEKMELIITGRNAPEELIKKANLVTEMKPIKHYMDEGINARKGIEY